MCPGLETPIEDLSVLIDNMPWNQVGYAHPSTRLDPVECRRLRERLRMDKTRCEEGIRMRLERWRERMKSSIKGNRKEMARWVREESLSLKGVREGEEIVVHPLRVLESIERAWRGVFWSDESVEPLRESEGGTASERHLDPLTPLSLKEACDRRTRGAPGPDGVTLGMLKKLPLSMWELATEILAGVERTAEWPGDLLWVRVAALAKPGCEGPPAAGRVRLIAVENLLVRCWATCRAVALRPWLVRVIGEGVIGGVAGRTSTLAATNA